ncbi:MAG: hypothetical protein IPL19_01210 [Sandaracinaceae bacterium]|nr:hypothetical protein [Sandaracinaceae bacterium]MBK8406578.1 hypothetical protein [Sandaracinaceae bacterium]MBP7680868.1 hypothetical protein [Deltaproteobacteria bacterium]
MGLAHTWSFALIVVLTLGCEGGPHFVERELLLGNGGTYELSALNVRDVDDVSVSVSGDAVTAQLTSEPGLLGPRAVVRVEAVAEGVSVVELQRREDARVVDQLSIEVARVEELRVEQVLEADVAYLQEPFGVLVGEPAVLRFIARDERGRVFDQFSLGHADVDPGVVFQELWSDHHFFQGTAAGPSVVSVDVGHGQVRDVVVPLVEPADIASIRIVLVGDGLVRVAATTSDGLPVSIYVADVDLDGEARQAVGLGVLYRVGPSEPPSGSVVRARWEGLTATHVY